jgi:hypothetical protein
MKASYLNHSKNPREEETPIAPSEGPSPEVLYQWYLMAGGKGLYSHLVDNVLDARRSFPEQYEGTTVKESLYYLLKAMLFTQGHTLDELVHIAEQYEAEMMAKLPQHLQEFCYEFRTMLDEGQAA